MAKAIKAVIFDFNGTLFNDTHFHDTAWKEFASRYGKNLSPGELDKNIHGFTNREIFTYIFKRSLEENELYQFYEEKEEIYRFICQKNSAKCILTKGAEDFFNYLLEKNIPRLLPLHPTFPM